MDVFAKRRAALAKNRPLATAKVAPGDIARVLALPRVFKNPAVDWSKILKSGAQPINLRPVQESALESVAAHGGGLFPIGVGHGKTLISLLAGAVMGCDVAIVLVAPATLPNMRKWLADCEGRYHMPQTELVSWGALSNAGAAAMLDAWGERVTGKKAVLVADEAHFARNPGSARTQRLFRWLKANPDVAFVALSGTLTTRRLKDFAHLSHRALRHKSPVPGGQEGKTWDLILAGEPYNAADVATVRPLWDWAQVSRGELPPRSMLTASQEKLLAKAFGERLATCPGVVLCEEPSCNSALYIREWNIKPSIDAVELWARADKCKVDELGPDGEEFADAQEAAMTARRLAFGYYYTWDWGPEGPNPDWLAARNYWSSMCRKLIQRYNRPNFDTRGLVEAEAARRYNAGSREEWIMAWRDWKNIEPTANPVTVPVWLSTWPLEQIIKQAMQDAPSIIWYQELAIADKLEQLGVLVRRAGQETPTNAVTCALSVRSHGVGLNLQDRWSRQVFACMPANGSTWEQVLGRTHRPGQPEDEVWATVPQWTRSLREPFAQARSDAFWIESSTSGRQRLTLATYV
jgi:hypothetical protein